MSSTYWFILSILSLSQIFSPSSIPSLLPFAIAFKNSALEKTARADAPSAALMAFLLYTISSLSFSLSLSLSFFFSLPLWPAVQGQVCLCFHFNRLNRLSAFHLSPRSTYLLTPFMYFTMHYVYQSLIDSFAVAQCPQLSNQARWLHPVTAPLPLTLFLPHIPSLYYPSKCFAILPYLNFFNALPRVQQLPCKLLPSTSLPLPSLPSPKSVYALLLRERKELAHHQRRARGPEDMFACRTAIDPGGISVLFVFYLLYSAVTYAFFFDLCVYVLLFIFVSMAYWFSHSRSPGSAINISLE